MARTAGRFGRVYMGLASDTAVAEPVAFLSSWSMDASTERTDVTAFGDASKVYIAGLPDASGEFSGFYDTATSQSYAAAADGLARRLYIYPSTASTGTYWFGTAYVDFQVNASVDGAAEISSSWSAATPFQKVGP